MPKIVDHEQRKERIAEACWRVILKRGMKGATVRNIAKEAGLSPGSLRHYFSSQGDLYLYAMNLVKERVRKRMEKIAFSPLPAKEKMVRILSELLPLNTETHAEMEVWLHFIFHFYGKEGAADGGVRSAIQAIMDGLETYRLLKEGIDKELETERLYALIDGLALHKLLEGGRLSDQKLIEILKSHIDSIVKDERDAGGAGGERIREEDR